MLCTGNICRSPAAEAMLRHRLHALGVEARIRSAGLLDDGRPAHTSSVDTLAVRGLDITAHRSRRLTAEIVRFGRPDPGHGPGARPGGGGAGARGLPEGLHAQGAGPPGRGRRPRGADESLADWLARAHAGRTSADLLGDSDADDVADPIGLPRSAYQRMVEDLDDQLDRLVALIWAPRSSGALR